MYWYQWLPRSFRKPPRRPRLRPVYAKPRLEALEDRLAPASWSGTIPNGTVWASGQVQSIVGNVDLPRGSTLTIQPGAVIQFNSGTSMTAEGTVSAVATAASPIYFTSYRDSSPTGGANTAAAGDWGAITFNAGSDASTIDHAVVRYGGGNGTVAEVITGANVALKDSTISSSNAAGTRITGSSPTLANDAWQNNVAHFGSAGAAISMDLASSPVITAPTFSGNGFNAAVLDSGSISGSVKWNNPAVGYQLSGSVTVPTGATLEIDAGQTVQLGMPFNSGVDIVVNGTLRSLGTAAAPVTVTSYRDNSTLGGTNNAVADDWGSLTLNAGAAASVVSNTVLRYGGGYSEAAEAFIAANATVSNSTFASAYGNGLNITASSPTLAADSFLNNGNAAIETDLASNPAITNPAVSGNKYNGMLVDGTTLSASTTWAVTGIVYCPTANSLEVPTGDTLTMAPGVIVKPLNQGWLLNVDGTLKAQGTTTQPVILTSILDNSAGGATFNLGVLGSGEGPRFWFTTRSGGNVMDHVDVRYGASLENVDSAHLGTVNVDSTLALSNSVVRSSGHAGVFVVGSATLTNDLIVNNVGGVQAEASANLTAVNNTIDGNNSDVILDSPTATLTNNLITGAHNVGITETGPTHLTMGYNDVYNPASTNYGGLADQTGQNGNLSLDPHYVNVADLQYELRPGSPVEDAGTRQGAPAADFFGNPPFQDPNITGRGDGSGYSIGAIWPQQVATSNVDLTTLNVTGPTTGTQGMSATVNWTVTDVGTGAATGSWSDAVYLSDTPTWTPYARFLTRVQHTGDLGPGQSYSGTATFTLNNVLPGNHYFIVRTNDLQDVFEGLAFANNAAAAPTPIGFAMPTLTPGTPYSDRFTAAGQSNYYQVAVAAGQTLVFNLQSAGGSGSVELYVSRGAVPSRSQFDFSAGSGLTASPRIVVPTTQPGTYYVLAYAASGAVATSAFTLTAGTAGFGVTGASPNTAGNSGPVTIAVTGAGLTAATQASLVAPDGTTLPATATQLGDATQLYATFDLTGKATGSYGVKLTQGTQSVLAPGALAVTAGTPGHLSIDFVVPGGIRAGRLGTVTVNYTNDGGADLPAPILDIVSDNPSLRFTTDTSGRGGTVEFLAINSSGPAGVLPPGAHGSMSFYFIAGTNVTSSDFTLQAQSAAQNGTTLSWAGAQAAMQPPGVSSAAWAAVYANFLADVGTTLGSFQALLDREATYLSRLGEYTGDEARLMAMEFQQAGDFGAIDQRSLLGAFGYGFPDPTAITATADASGNVTIQSGTSQRVFLIQPNNGYRGAPGDLGVLTLQNGAYQLTNADGSITAFRTDGRLAYQQDKTGNRITAGYTGTQLTSLTDAQGHTVAITYNAQGRISQVTDPVGRVTTYGYDATGQYLVAVTGPLGTTRFTYVTGQGAATQNAIQSITNPDGTQALFSYDARGRLAKTTAAGGADEVDYAYDGLGGTTATDALKEGTTQLVNELGLPLLTQDALGNVTRYVYDGADNLVQTVQADGSTVAVTPDNGGNPATTVNPLGGQVSATFDPVLGTLQTLRDPLGNSLSFRMDAHGNPLSMTFADGKSDQFTYDAFGNVTSATDRAGNAVRYTYNGQDELVRADFADGTSATFTYDAHGNLATATNAAGTTTYSYNLTTDLLMQVTYPGGRYLKFAYDAAGRRTQSVDQGGFTVNYLYDSLGRLHGLTDGSNNAIVTYTYDGVGRLARADLGNGTYTTYAYFANGLVKTVANFAAGGAPLSQYDYSYDALGHTLTMTTGGATTTYGYDGTGQLTSVSLPGGRTITYRYDAAGNRTAVTDSGATTNYATDNLNQYTTVGSAQLTYDADGNLVQRKDGTGTTTYTYNAQGQLASVTTPTDTYSYLYDATGIRIGEVHNGVQTNYLVDPSGLASVVGEYGATGQLVAHYTQGLGLTSRVDATGTADYYAFDATGNTSLITGTGGTVVNRYSYLPFGESLSATGSLPNAFTYGGQLGVMSDGSGLDYMRARYYDPGTGRFTAMDPIGPSGGLNLYAYTRNDPVDRVDPSGRASPGGLILAILRQMGVATQYSAELTPTMSAAEMGAIYRNYDSWNTYLNSLSKDELIAFARQEGVAASQIEAYAAGEAGVAAGAGATGAAAGSETLAVGAPGAAAGAGGGTVAVNAGGAGAAAGSGTVALEGGGAAIAQTGGTVSLESAGAGAAGGSSAGPLGLAFGVGLGAGYAAYTTNALHNNDFADATYETFLQPNNAQYSDKVLARAKELGFNGVNGAFLSLLRDEHVGVFAPIDPNDLSGPQGFGTQHFVAPTQTLPYNIQFENKPTAGAAALVVQVTQQLDSHLDWTTFQLGSFGFGPYTVQVPAGRRYYSTRVDATATVGVFVDVTANFDPTTGQATWTFSSVDPTTGQLPTGATAGFLPPDNSSGAGEGFVNYTARARAGVTTGTAASAQATVYFDAGLPDQSALATPPFTNTFDAGAPTATVAALPAQSSASFAVQWSGSDDAGGSGIASYDVFVSDNGGPFTAWLTATTATSATFSGPVKHTYGFYAVATDNVGNRQATPAAAQASTTVTPLPAGFSYDPTSKTLTISVGAQSWFFFSQASTQDASGIHTTYTFSVNGASASFPDTALAGVSVVGSGAGNGAVLTTNDTYTGTDGQTHETAEQVLLGSGGATLEKLNGQGTAAPFVSLTGFQDLFAIAGQADQGAIIGTAGVFNYFAGYGSYAFMSTGPAFYYVSGASSVVGYSEDYYDWGINYDGSGPSYYTAAGTLLSEMSGTDHGQAFLNEAYGFHFNEGIATHAGDTAYLSDSAGNDVLAGYGQYASLTCAANGEQDYLTTYNGNFFAQVYAYAFNGGYDTASVDASAAGLYTVYYFDGHYGYHRAG